MNPVHLLRWQQCQHFSLQLVLGLLVVVLVLGLLVVVLVLGLLVVVLVLGLLVVVLVLDLLVVVEELKNSRRKGESGSVYAQYQHRLPM